MKKGLIFATTLAMMLGVGVAVGAHQSEPKVATVEATSTEVTLYINQFDGGGTWNNFSYYLFGGSAGAKAAWPGESFTDSMKTKTPNEYDQYQYVLTVDTAKYPKLILVGNPANWGGSQAQTEDLVIADMTNNGLYCGDQITSTNKFNVGYYGYSTKTVYMLDLKGDVYNTNHYCHTWATGKSGTAWPGVEMEKVAGSNNLYSLEINSQLDNVIFNNNGDNQTETISSVAANNAYVVYPDNGYNTLTYDAASFVDKYMKFETKWLDDSGDGSCKSAGWYSSAKTAFNGKSAQEKSDILSHEPTSYRLAAWAKANGDKLNDSNNLVSSAIIFGDDASINDNATLIVIVIAAISALAFTTLLVLKKRKQR